MKNDKHLYSFATVESYPEFAYRESSLGRLIERLNRPILSIDKSRAGNVWIVKTMRKEGE